jgi:uncharacterized membrane protein YcaP (DUF421 family)
MGKRQIGQMEASEFVVTMLVADLAAIPIQDSSQPLYMGLIPIATVYAMELLLSFLSLRSILFRRVLCGKPVILVENGKIMQENLRKTRVTLDELTGHLREKDVLDIQNVQYAILETDGNLSVFPFPQYRPASAKEANIQSKEQSLPVTIICDGKLLKKNLFLTGKDQAWVSRILRKKKSTISQTYLMTVDDQENIFFCKKE